MHFVSGMPVRAAFLEIDDLQDADREGLELTIVGGSLGAAVFATIVPDALAQVDPALRTRLRVSQQCRAEQVDMLQARYREIGINAEIRTFFDDMPDRFAKSDLVISRAGASSVAELAAAGRPAILIPFAGAMDDHQTENARQLEAAGGGVCLAEADLDPAALAARMADLLSDADRLAEMGHKARGLAAADAADTIAGYALDLAGQAGPETGPDAGPGSV
jgi:UDP-N-acetylglucosamine--N-acetylmuramyl-(pentapeptide) pyrophosphoryl-undecaprenol N-acetylglucosamine transferase